jgi:hypothetical protein
MKYLGCVWMGEAILILGRISWNRSKRRDLETFHWGIAAERFVEMNCGVKTGRMVFHTDSCPSTLFLALKFKVFTEDWPPPPPLSFHLWLLLPDTISQASPAAHKSAFDHANQEVHADRQPEDSSHDRWKLPSSTLLVLQLPSKRIRQTSRRISQGNINLVFPLPFTIHVSTEVYLIEYEKNFLCVNQYSYCVNQYCKNYWHISCFLCHDVIFLASTRTALTFLYRCPVVRVKVALKMNLKLYKSS